MQATRRIAPIAVAVCVAASGSASDAQDRADVLATFATADLGRTRDSPKSISVGPKQAQELAVPDWDRPWPHADPPTLAIDRARVAIRVDSSGDPAGETARSAAVDAGLVVQERTPVGTDGWQIVDLTAPLPSDDDVRGAILALANDVRVDFVSPVFDHPTITGGWLIMTPRIVVRVRPAFLPIADAVVLDAAPDLALVERDVAGLPGAYLLRLDDGTGLDVLERCEQLALDPRFAWVEPSALQTMVIGGGDFPDDPIYWASWGLHNDGNVNGWPCCEDIDLDAPEAWEIALGDWNVRVLVMDTGTQLDHPDLNVSAGRDFSNGLPAGFGDGSPIGVCDFHGTAVAGCISERIDNGIGTTGIAPLCRSVPARIAEQMCDSTDFASFEPIWVANALFFGLGQGIRISNSSFRTGPTAIMSDIYDLTRANGMVHFASAGNGGDDGDGDPALVFPASLESVVGVAALDPDGTLTFFSNYGPGLGFAAPGINIRTTDLTGPGGYHPSDYTSVSGTSFASPYTAGATALVASALGGESWSEAAVGLLALFAQDNGIPGYDQTYGWGIPNPRNALDVVGPDNNFCVNATDITSCLSNPSPIDTTTATAFDGEPQDWCEVGDAGVSNSVWYRFQPPGPGSLSINTNGSDYDTVLSVWLGACDFAWPLECDDDGGIGLASQIEAIPVAPPNDVYIKVSDYNTDPGGGLLDLNVLFTPDHDTCVNALPIGPGTHAVDTRCATPGEYVHPACEFDGDDGFGPDFFYRYTAPCDGELTVSTCTFTFYDTKLAVYGENIWGDLCPGTPFSGILLGCNDDDPDCGSGGSRLAIPVDAGAAYIIRLGGADGASGLASLSVSQECVIACFADINDDGVVDVDDLLAVIGAFGTDDPEADIAPVGGDGIVDVNDLLMILAGWGACP